MFINMKKTPANIVVITGCLGFIGYHLTKRCLEMGWYVYGIDSETYAANTWAINEFSKNSNFYYKKADIATLNSLPDCDYVINLAAETHVGNSIIDSNEFIKTNVSGVQNLLNLIKNKPANISNKPVLLHFSTDEVYGDILEGSHKETDQLKPSNPYSASKAAGDMMVLAWNRTYGVDYLIVRPTNNYGPYQHPEKLIPLSVKLLSLGKKIKLHDEGKPKRTWLHVEDTADAVIHLIKLGVKNEIFNIPGDTETTNLVVVKEIFDHWYRHMNNIGFKKELKFDDVVDLSFKREGQDVRYSIDGSKLLATGWKNKASLLSNLGHEGLNLLVYHYMASDLMKRW
jgi:dTDP-glucose 4,6-dehydratase